MFCNKLISKAIVKPIQATSNISLLQANYRFFQTSTVLDFNSTLNLGKKDSQKPLSRKQQIKENGPKRPQSAFFLYCKEVREPVAAQHPGLKPTQVIKLISEKWNNLSDSDKQPFVNKYNKLNEEYKIEKKNFINNLPPKKPVGPFIAFANDNRQMVIDQNPNITFGETTKILSKLWNEQNENERNYYLHNFQKKMKEWKELYDNEK